MIFLVIDQKKRITQSHTISEVNKQVNNCNGGMTLLLQASFPIINNKILKLCQIGSKNRYYIVKLTDLPGIVKEKAHQVK